MRKYAKVMSDECERLFTELWGDLLTNKTEEMERLIKGRIKPDCITKRNEGRCWQIKGKSYHFPIPVIKAYPEKYWILDIEREGTLSIDELEELKKQEEK